MARIPLCLFCSTVFGAARQITNHCVSQWKQKVSEVASQAEHQWYWGSRTITVSEFVVYTLACGVTKQVYKEENDNNTTFRRNRHPTKKSHKVKQERKQEGASPLRLLKQGGTNRPNGGAKKGTRDKISFQIWKIVWKWKTFLEKLKYKGEVYRLCIVHSDR